MDKPTIESNIICIADTHFKKVEQADRFVLETKKLLEENEQVELVIMLGDITETSKEVAWRILAKLKEGLGDKVMMLPGNHDPNFSYDDKLIRVGKKTMVIPFDPMSWKDTYAFFDAVATPGIEKFILAGHYPPPGLFKQCKWMERNHRGPYRIWRYKPIVDEIKCHINDLGLNPKKLAKEKRINDLPFHMVCGHYHPQHTLAAMWKGILPVYCVPGCAFYIKDTMFSGLPFIGKPKFVVNDPADGYPSIAIECP
jgi:metallophosphoesterase superfamily enzyme